MKATTWIVLTSLALGILVPRQAAATDPIIIVLCIIGCKARFIFDTAGRERCYDGCMSCAVDEITTLDETTTSGPPVCRLASRTTSSITVSVQDSDGLGAIGVLTSENATTNVPSFSPGTADTIFITSTKIDPTLPSRLELVAVDNSACNEVTFCDPVMTTVIRTTGKPVSDTYSGLPQEERMVTIFNSSPGLTKLDIIVNGTRFKVKHLANREERTIDVSSAMVQGNQNTITLEAEGAPGTSAGVLIWDGVTQD